MTENSINKTIQTAFEEGCETARFLDRITASEIHEISEWVDRIDIDTKKVQKREKIHKISKQLPRLMESELDHIIKYLDMCDKTSSKRIKYWFISAK